ncbi:MAG: radical SAM protein [Phycisphaerae bacterium]|nr:radical SAM protein [Phycisphaerae bacterium]
MLEWPRMLMRMARAVPAPHLAWLWSRRRDFQLQKHDGRVWVNTFFPPYPSNAFDRFIAATRAIRRGRRVPTSAYLAVTAECPFDCPHCSHAGRTDAEELTTQQWLDVIEELRRLGTCIVGFTGGEPVLRSDLPQLVAAAGPEMATIVFTSGVQLGSREADRLAEAGCDCVTVGIESADPDEHNRLRACGEGENSFAAASFAVEACRQAGIYTALSTVATHDKLNGEGLDAIYEMAREWGVGELRLLAPVATGSKAGCEAFMLDEPERRRLSDFQARHNRRGDDPAVLSFAYMEGEHCFGCGAGFHHLFVDAHGELCPCDLTPMSFGNVTRQPLGEIWQGMADRFRRPRRQCIMGDLMANRNNAVAEELATGPLPLPPELSATLIAPSAPDAPLPDGYRRILDV